MASKMIAPIFIFILPTTLVQSLKQGDSCQMKGKYHGAGVCTLLDNCQSVYEEIIDGEMVDKLCGYTGLKPIVCCPKIMSQITTTLPPYISKDQADDGRGVIARKKCREYSQSVYAWQFRPTLDFNHQAINVSLCAIKSRKLITGGTKAERKEFPHMAAVGYDLESGGIGWYCGGTLISEDFILTAAHCTYSLQWGNATWVRVGDLNLQRSDDGAMPMNRRIVKRIKHPEYKLPSQYHDIALLRLESRLPFTAWIRPACLYTAPTTGTTKAIATGWGRVDWVDDEGPSDLLKVTLPLVDEKTCNASYVSDGEEIRLPNGIIDDWLICAGEVGKDTCQGDSGGPLVVFSKPEYHCMYDVIGVTSFGKYCGSAVPGVYTRVYNYVPWIESIVWGNG